MVDFASDPPLDLPGPLTAARAFLRALGRLELVLAVAAFCFVVVLNCIQIGLRMGATFSIWWAQEVSQLAILTSYFLGIAYVYKLHQDVVILFVYQALRPGVRLRLYYLIQLLVAGFAVLVILELLSIAPMQLRFRTYILSIPKFYSSLPLLIASISMVLTAGYYAAGVAWAAGQGGSADPDLLERAVEIYPGAKPL